jgi:hypothetical protein
VMVGGRPGSRWCGSCGLRGKVRDRASLWTSGFRACFVRDLAQMLAPPSGDHIERCGDQRVSHGNRALGAQPGSNPCPGRLETQDQPVAALTAASPGSEAWCWTRSGADGHARPLMPD